jgi:phosphate-selective porin
MIMIFVVFLSAFFSPLFAESVTAPVSTQDKAATVSQVVKAPPLLPALKVKGFLQTYYSWLEKSSPYSNFEILRARMTLDSKIEEKVTGKIQVDFATTSNILLDAYLNYKPFPFLGFKMGQFKIPFSQEQIDSSAGLPFFHRTNVTSKLAYNYDIGIMAEGRLMHKMIYYGLAVVNGTGRNKSDSNQKKDVVGRVLVSPMTAGGDTPLKNLCIGASVQTGRQPDAGVDDELRNRYGALLKYNYAGFGLQAEYLYQELDRSTSKNIASGWYATVTYQVMSDLMAAMQFEMLDPDRAVEMDGNQAGSIGLDYMLDKIKFQVTYRLKKHETDVNPAKEYYFLTQIKY